MRAMRTTEYSHLIVFHSYAVHYYLSRMETAAKVHQYNKKILATKS